MDIFSKQYLYLTLFRAACALFIPIALLFSCGRSLKSKELKGDTTFTTVHYAFNWTNHDYRTVTAIKIKSRDTVKYLVPIMDTVRLMDTVKINGNPAVDSSGKVKLELRWPELPKQYLIVDYGKSWKK
jgi:hypothetical protein